MEFVNDIEPVFRSGKFAENLAILRPARHRDLATPLQNLVSRRQEASADWAALNATGEPGTDRAVMRRLSTTSLANPDPPFWITAFDGDHPTTMERIAMAQLWEELH